METDLLHTTLRAPTLAALGKINPVDIVIGLPTYSASMPAPVNPQIAVQIACYGPYGTKFRIFF